jgi:hypothetical protein
MYLSLRHSEWNKKVGTENEIKGYFIPGTEIKAMQKG